MENLNSRKRNHRRIPTWPEEVNGRFGTKHNRRGDATKFRNVYLPGFECPVIRACIWPHAAYSLPDIWFGISWVAVHGMDSICLVTKHKDLVRLVEDVSPSKSKFATEYVLGSFWNAMVSKVEDIESPPPGDRLFNERSEKPFACVSMPQLSDEVCELYGYKASNATSDVVCDPDKAIEFLQEEMKSKETFTFDKTLLTAISAFQCLFLQKFKADDIRVFAWEKEYVIGKELQQKHEDPDLDELLAIMNNNGLDTD